MKLHRIFPAIMLVAALLCVLIPPATAQSQGKPGQFDYYELNLSWAPQFCATHASSPECQSHPGFILHGLWPQDFNGRWPSNCYSHEPSPTNYSAWLGMTPSLSLLHHEWRKHGECTLLSGNQFFALAQRAYQSVKIPPFFTQLRQQANLPPSRIKALFLQANPSLSAADINLTCYDNQLSAVQVCFSKSLSPVACKNLRPCRAWSIRILPPR